MRKKVKVKHYQVVTGCARSGTSAMMGSLREAGIPIAGYKFPINLELKDGENLSGGAERPIDTNETRKNKMGFWEVSEVLREGLQKNTYSGALIKIPCQALHHSTPKLISKALFMIRPPRELITSMKRDVTHAGAWDTHMIYLETWLRQILSIQYLVKNKIPFIVVKYLELVRHPESVLSRVTFWFGRGSFEWGVKYIDVKQRRSHKNIDRTKHEYVKLCEELYDDLANGEIDKIINIDIEPLMEVARQSWDKMIESGKIRRK